MTQDAGPSSSSSSQDDPALLLDGLRVLDLSRLLPGPFCSLLLADMGAEVIKIEDPRGGDYARYYPPMVGSMGAFFASINRNKRSVAVDLKRPEGAQLVRQLVERSDVLIESFRPGVMERLGLGHQALRALRPELIICPISGYGQDGPLRERAGHDLNYLARSGVLDQLGHDEQVRPVGVQIADLLGGALYGALGVTAALWRRARTGQGCTLDVSMTEGALSMHLMTHAAMSASGHSPRRGQELLSGGVPCYDVYATRDGGRLAVAALEPKFWIKLVEALGLPQLAHEGLAQGPDGERVRQALAQVFATRDRDEWAARLGPLDVCVEPVLDPAEVLEDELLRARQMFFTLQGVTHTRTPLTPRERAHDAAPALGQDTRACLRQLLRLDEQTLDALCGAGVILQADEP